MDAYTKEQSLHLDLPEAFRGNFKETNGFSNISLDFILLAITIFMLLDDRK